MSISIETTLCKGAVVHFSPKLAARLMFLSMIMTIMLPSVSTGFVIHPTAPNAAVVALVSRNRMIPVASRSMPQTNLRMSNDDDDSIDGEGTTADNCDSDDDDDSEEEDDDDCDFLEPVFVADVRGRPAGVVLEDLGWRVEKLRLEEANKRRFLKSGPRFLPYVECKKWVQAWGERWTSAEEWNEWIEDGEKRNSYIPSRPQEYYTRTGDWISWEDFLGV